MAVAADTRMEKLYNKLDPSPSIMTAASVLRNLLVRQNILTENIISVLLSNFYLLLVVLIFWFIYFLDCLIRYLGFWVSFFKFGSARSV